MFIGLVGNLLVIYVVCNYSRLKTVTNTYLLHLALSDLVFLSGAPFFVSSIIIRSWIFGRFLCKLFFLTQGVNQYTSIIILAFLSFDRFLAVCHAAKSIQWRAWIHPHLLLLLTWLFSFVLMLPIVIFTTLQETVASTVQCMIIPPASQSRAPYLIFVVYTSTMTFFLPLMFMIYFYTKIVHRLQYRASKQHRPSRASIRTRRKVTILVLSVISVHLLCCAPYWIFQLMATSEFLPQTSRILMPTSSVAQFLLFVNSSANPILYAFISEVFRSSFQRVFHCCVIARRTPCVHEKTVAKRPITTATGTKMIHLQNKALPTRRTSINHRTEEGTDRNFNRQLSVVSKDNEHDAFQRENRLLSLAPNASVFNSEASGISDV
jgi:hypothetical protein